MDSRCMLRVTGTVLALTLAQACLLASGAGTYADLIAKSRRAEMKGDYAQAEALIKEGLALLLQPDCRDGLVLQNELGHIHQVQGRLAEAESDYRKALALNAQSKKPDAEERASSLNNLGSLALSHGSLTEAEAEVREAAAVFEQAGSTESRTAGLVFLNLCNIEQEQENFREARSFCDRAEPILLRSQGNLDLDCAKLLISEGLLSFQTGDFRDALQKGRKGFEIVKRLEFVPPLDKAAAEQKLSLVLMSAGQFADAEKLLNDAVAIDRADPSEANRSLPEALSSLASVQMRMNQLAAAEENAGAGLRLAKPESDVAARLHSSLGCIAMRRKNWRAAREQFHEALQIWQDLHRDKTTEYAAGLVNLGTLADRTGKHKQAESLYRAALAIHMAVLGPEHPQVAEDYADVAAQRYARKQFDDALALYEKAREIELRVYGPGSSQAAGVWRDMGVVDFAAKRLCDSEKAYSEAVAAYKAMGARGEDFATCLREYAAVLRDLRRFQEAETADLQATRIQVTNAILADRAGRSAAGGLSLR